MLPEEQELQRLTAEQTELEDEVAQGELALETERTELAQFQRRYYQTVGRFYVELDAVLAQQAAAEAAAAPADRAAAHRASEAQAQAKQSADEAGDAADATAISEPIEITPEIKAAYRQACKLMHPDRATSEAERLRRTEFMSQVNVAYERGDHEEISRLQLAFGADPEALQGHDIGTQMIKAIRRIAQLRRRRHEIAADTVDLQQNEMMTLKQTVEDAEALGGDPLGDLGSDLLRQISELRVVLNMRIGATV